MALRHPEYYMQDGDVIFLVGYKLFKIHKRLLIQSEDSAFVAMLDLPRPSEIEGETDETIIELKDDSMWDFECLMRILYPPLLESPLCIPLHIFAQAMRTATKYCMREVQAAIVKVIKSKPLGSGISGAIDILCFIAEFPEYFRKSHVQAVFVQACSTSYYPSTGDLMRLMRHPDLMLAMMKYREGKLNPDGAVWKPKPESPPNALTLMRPPKKVVTPMDTWLAGELNSLGLTKN